MPNNPKKTAALNKSPPILPDINIEARMNSSQEWERRIATFSIEDLLQVCSIFYGDAGKKKSGPVSGRNQL